MSDSETEISPDEKLRQWNYFDHLRKKLLKDLKRKNDHFDIIQVQTGKRVFPCHRFMLASNSEYFAALFRNDGLRTEQSIFSLPLEYVSECAFSVLHEALYNGVLKIDVNNLKAVVIASSYLQMSYFIDHCKDYICKNIEHLDICELIMMRQLQLELSSLYEFIKKCVLRNFSELHSQMFAISLEVFKDLFSDPELYVSSQELLLDFARGWICHDLEHRKQYIREVCSILKPSHTPSDQSLKFLSVLECHLQTHADINIALNVALEIVNQYNDPREQYKQMNLDSLFFLQPNVNSPVMRIVTFKEDKSLVFDSLQLPITDKFSVDYEGCVSKNVFYISVRMNDINNDVTFYCIRKSEEGWIDGWIELTAPQNICPECLITCNSKVYLCGQSSEEHQIAAFEPVLNRWLKVPPPKYLRREAGVASNGTDLFMVGGIPQNETPDTPRNIIEMYDSRCGRWSQLWVSPKKLQINHLSYSKRVCYLNNSIYLFPPKGGNLSVFDIRNNKWQFYKPNSVQTDKLGYAITVREEIWFIYNSLADGGIMVFNAGDGELISTVQSAYFHLKPIFLPAMP